MPIITILEVHFPEQDAEKATKMLGEILVDTRAFEGCLGVDVLRDPHDAGHLLCYEHWESMTHDQAYRAWRAGDGKTALGTLTDRPNVLTFWDPIEL